MATHKKKPPVKKLTDKFTTAAGEEMTRRQLSNLVARANYRIEQSKNYLTEKEYNHLRDNYEKRIAALGLYEEGAQRLTLKGITDPKQLRAIEATARGALGSSYVSKRKYKEIRQKRFEEYLCKEYVSTKEQFDLLESIFSSDEWGEMQDLFMLSSEQFIQSMQDELYELGAPSDYMKKAIKELLKRYIEVRGNEDFEIVPEEDWRESGEWGDILYNYSSEEYAEWLDDRIRDTAGSLINDREELLEMDDEETSVYLIGKMKILLQRLGM